MRPSWIQSGRPKPNYWSPYKKAMWDPQGRSPCDSEDRDQNSASASQGSPQRLGEGHRTEPLLRHLEETNLVDGLVVDFWLPELKANSILLFEAPPTPVCCAVLWWPQEANNGHNLATSGMGVGWAENSGKERREGVPRFMALPRGQWSHPTHSDF